ncbi:MAG TPA: hypothetical protein VN457_07145 [Chlamydiales bacterium]|nr:hypothetical protein [Chlamydiales bacterium]
MSFILAWCRGTKRKQSDPPAEEREIPPYAAKQQRSEAHGRRWSNSGSDLDTSLLIERKREMTTDEKYFPGSISVAVFPEMHTATDTALRAAGAHNLPENPIDILVPITPEARYQAQLQTHRTTIAKAIGTVASDLLTEKWVFDAHQKMVQIKDRQNSILNVILKEFEGSSYLDNSEFIYNKINKLLPTIDSNPEHRQEVLHLTTQKLTHFDFTRLKTISLWFLEIFKISKYCRCHYPEVFIAQEFFLIATTCCELVRKNEVPNELQGGPSIRCLGVDVPLALLEAQLQKNAWKINKDIILWYKQRIPPSLYLESELALDWCRIKPEVLRALLEHHRPFFEALTL